MKINGKAVIVGVGKPGMNISPDSYFYDFLGDILWCFTDDSKGWEFPDPRWMWHTSCASQFHFVLKRKRVSGLRGLIRQTEKEYKRSADDRARRIKQ